MAAGRRGVDGRTCSGSGQRAAGGRGAESQRRAESRRRAGSDGITVRQCGRRGAWHISAALPRAGFWIRMVALLIDVVLVGFLMSLLRPIS